MKQRVCVDLPEPGILTIITQRNFVQGHDSVEYHAPAMNYRYR